MERITLFADVLLPLPVPGLFTYRIPQIMNDEVEPGKRVVVQFGRKKIYTAIVRRVHENVPSGYFVKYILSVLDNVPVVNQKQLIFWDWIAKYYMSFQGEVMNVALPSAMKLASETRIIKNPSFNSDYSELNEKEYLVAEALDIQNSLTINEVSKIVEFKKVIPLIKNLIEKKVILIEEEVREKYRPKIETYVRLAEKYNDENNLKTVFDELEKRAFKQLELLMAFLRLSGKFEKKHKEIKRQELIKNAETSASILNTLVKKGILETYDKISSRLKNYDAVSSVNSIKLTSYQEEAYRRIKDGFEQKDVVLLHGVTSSGKTEIYIKLINETILKGKQVLFLLPEIALTTQIINRLRKYFGDKVGVYHSKYSEFERVEIWNMVIKEDEESKLVSKKYQIVLGPRSALFLPYNDLGLIIIDEEHDSSYKQYNQSPHYLARDAAIMLAKIHNAKTLLGSATPSIESYFNAISGKYSLVNLKERYRGLQLPETIVADLRNETRRKTMRSHFSSVLIRHIKEALENQKQVILFQNRRGFSLRLECESCSWMPSCKNCDVTLIYHKHINLLKCHYCGYSTRVPDRCPECGHTALMMRGFGTEKIEEELSLIFPTAKISRMDLDTTRSKNAYQKIINDFEEKRIDILVGTQMVTKGLDFDNVSVVGILNADNLMSYPDFRSFERSFQLMAQVSGRAGRKYKRGKVIIQTYNPSHQVIWYVIKNDYEMMFRSQVQERRNFRYPPFYRLIRLQLKHKTPEILNRSANQLAGSLRNILGKRILGPEYPVVSRIKNLYLKDILIKLEKSGETASMKEMISKCIDDFKMACPDKSVRVVIDVDPV